MENNELYHYGVLGMKWGRRNVRGHAGPGRYLTKKRQLAGDKRDLEALNRGEHLSFGITKKRQAAYDKRDRELLERRIAKTTQELANKQAAKADKSKYVTVRKANINAKVAGGKAAKESFANDKKNLSGIGSGRKAILNANKAASKARQESLAKDRAKNKSIRADKKAAKAMKKLSQQKIKDLEKKYGKLEDSMTYGKNANAEKNKRIEKQMDSIEAQIRREEKRLKK